MSSSRASYLAGVLVGGVTAAAGRRRRAPLSKSAKIGLGLLATLVGLFLLADLLPAAPGPLAHALPVAAVGVVALWVGGILMGIGSRS